MFRSLAFAFLLLPAAAIAAPSVEGRWITHDGKALMEIGRCGAKVCGRIAKVLAPTPKGPPKDVHNPDARLRDRPIEGLTVLTGFTAAGSSWHGQIYSPEDGKTYRSTMERTGPETMKLRGCVAIFCKGFVWKKAR